MRTLRILGVVLVVAVVAAAVSTIIGLTRRPPGQVGRGNVSQAGVVDTTQAAVQRAEPSVVLVERSAVVALPSVSASPAASASPSVSATPSASATVAPAPGPSPAAASGTGVVVDPRGYVLTSEALVAGAGSLTVAVPGGKPIPARVVGSDPLFALTLLKVDAPNLHALGSGGASALSDGSGVVVVAAAPYSEVAVGAVASAHSSVTIQDPSNPLQRRDLNDLLSLDVAARDGQLGAPLVDAAGRLAGLVVATGSQLYAVDMTQAQPDVQQLIDSGHVSYPSLGFEYRQLSTAEAAEHGVLGGVLVTAVASGMPEGLVSGDVVISINDNTLDPLHPLQRILRGMTVRQGVTLVVKSGSTRHNLSLSVQLVSP